MPRNGTTGLSGYRYEIGPPAGTEFESAWAVVLVLRSPCAGATQYVVIRTLKSLYTSRGESKFRTPLFRVAAKDIAGREREEDEFENSHPFPPDLQEKLEQARPHDGLPVS